ncbi:MAG: trigger factor [Betaproteobacteria bacterium]|nr:trigger factor [Betaproteobacteria bacterium]
MQTSIETISKLERRLNMAVPSDQIEKAVERRLKEMSRTIKMHGFRPGKVPMKIVAQQYGSQIRSEVIGDAVQKTFTDAVREQNLRVAGYPRIEPKDAGGNGNDLAFSATFEVYPEVALGDVGNSRIERLALTVSDADVDSTIAILRKQRVTYEDAPRPAVLGDRVTVDFTGTIDGTEFPGGKGSGMAIVLGEGRMLPEFEKNVTGMSGGESRSFDLKFPDDYGAKEVAGKMAVFEVKANKVEAPKLPEVDAEFARTLGVEDGDIGKMRQDVKSNVEREVRKRIDSDLKQKAMQALLDASKFDVPKALVDMELQRMVQAARADLEKRGIKMENLPINPEMFETQAKRRVSLGLVVGELVKQKNLVATPEQVRAFVDDYAATYEQPSEVIKWMYSDAQRLNEFEGMAVEANVVRWLLEHAKVEDKAIGFDELMGRAGAQA